MITNHKVFRIDESEKQRILNIHQEATKSHYLTEAVETVTGRLMDGVDAGMMGTELMKLFKDPNQKFLINMTEGDVKLPNNKMIKPTDRFTITGTDSGFVVHPEQDEDVQVYVSPRKGKIMLFLGA